MVTSSNLVIAVLQRGALGKTAESRQVRSLPGTTTTWTKRLAIELKRAHRNLRAVLEPQTARTMRAAEMADRVDVAGVLHAERHRLRQAVIRPLNAASNPSALSADEVAPNVAAGQVMSEIVHGYSTTPRALSA
jgi:hypothetical protein